MSLTPDRLKQSLIFWAASIVGLCSGIASPIAVEGFEYSDMELLANGSANSGVGWESGWDIISGGGLEILNERIHQASPAGSTRELSVPFPLNTPNDLYFSFFARTDASDAFQFKLKQSSGDYVRWAFSRNSDGSVTIQAGTTTATSAAGTFLADTAYLVLSKFETNGDIAYLKLIDPTAPGDYTVEPTTWDLSAAGVTGVTIDRLDLQVTAGDVMLDNIVISASYTDAIAALSTDVPVVDSQSVILNEDGSRVITLLGSDVGNKLLSYNIITSPSSGVLIGTAPQLIYTPNANYSGSDSFTYTVDNGMLTSEEATVSISVIAEGSDALFMLSPKNEATLYEYNPELSWIKGAAAESVRIQIASDSSFSNVINDDEIYSYVNRFVPAADLAPGDYWWRAVTKNVITETWGNWSSARKFTIVDNPVVSVSTSDSFSRIRTIIANAGDNVRIVFESGSYTFSINDVGTIDYFIKLTNRSNVVIDGNNSDIIFDGKITSCGFSLIDGNSGSRDITIKNFNIYRNYPMALPLEIVSVDTGAGSFICERVNASYPLPSEDTFQYVADSGWVLDKNTDKIKFGTPLTLFVDTTKGGLHNMTQWKYFLTSGAANYISNLQPGDIFLKDEKYGIGRFEFRAVRASNLTFYNVNSYSTSINMNFSAEKCELIKVINCDFLKDEFIGLVSDGIHLKDVRGGAWIENNTLEYNGDDGFAIHPKIRAGQFSQIDDSTVEVGASDDVQVGDRLHFFENFSGFQYVTESTVVSVTQTGQGSRLNLADAVVTTNVTSYCNYSLAGPETMIRGNVLDGSRGDGFHLTLNGAIIENNILTDIGERAMTFTPTAGGGSYSQQVMVRNNTFNNMTRSDPMGTFGAFLVMNNGTVQRTLHNNISFVNNWCFGYQDCAVQIGEARDIKVKGNVFSSCEYHDYTQLDKDIVLLEETDNIYIQDNVFKEHRNRSANDYVDLINANGWVGDNPNFNDQFEVNYWLLSKINHTETGSIFLRGTSQPSRSLTTVRLTGSGQMNGNATTDTCTFSHIDLQGDAYLSMTILDFSEPTSTQFAKGGLMLRETDDADSKMVMFGVREYNGAYSLQHLSRSSVGGGLTANKTQSLTGFPVYVALERDGNSIVSSYSYDELSWTIFHSSTISMSNVTLGGVAVTSQAPRELATLLGDELHIEYE